MVFSMVFCAVVVVACFGGGHLCAYVHSRYGFLQACLVYVVIEVCAFTVLYYVATTTTHL